MVHNYWNHARVATEKMIQIFVYKRVDHAFSSMWNLSYSLHCVCPSVTVEMLHIKLQSIINDAKSVAMVMQGLGLYLAFCLACNRRFLFVSFSVNVFLFFSFFFLFICRSRYQRNRNSFHGLFPNTFTGQRSNVWYKTLNRKCIQFPGIGWERFATCLNLPRTIVLYVFLEFRPSRNRSSCL